MPILIGVILLGMTYGIRSEHLNETLEEKAKMVEEMREHDVPAQFIHPTSAEAEHDADGLDIE